MASQLRLLTVSWAMTLLALALALAPLSWAQMCADVPTAQYEDPSGKYAIKYDVVQGWYQNRSTFYWDFGPRSAAGGPASNPGSAILAIPIWVPVYANGSSAGRNIIDAIPCMPGYSDLWLVHLVTLPDSTPKNMYKNAADIQSAISAGTANLTVPGVMRNCPVVPFKSTINDTKSGNPDYKSTIPKSVFGWFRNESSFYFDFGPVNFTATMPVWKINYDNGTSEGMNLIDVIPGDAAYTPFWQLTFVTVPETVGPNAVRSAAVASANGYAMNYTGAVVNCPVAYTDATAAPMDPSGSTAPGNSNTMTPSPADSSSSMMNGASPSWRLGAEAAMGQGLLVVLASALAMALAV